MALGFGDYAQATFDFIGESPGDLSLRVGEVVRITDTIDKNWLVGEKVSHETPPSSGSFPSSFVTQLVLPSVRTGQKIFLALMDFMAEQTGDLELSKGDIITGIEAVDEAWWRGKNGPLKGIFPLSFVAELWHDDGLRSRSYSARAGSLKSRSGSLAGSRTNSIGGYSGLSGDSVGKELDSSITKVTEPTFARALVDVSPQLDGELAFQLGDLIEITEIIDADWFFGRSHQKEGLVSAVCVELLDDLNEGAPLEDVGNSGGEGLKISDNGHLNHNTASAVGAAPLPPQQKVLQDIGEEEYRLRNSSSGSYTSENTKSHDAEIMPYGQVLYSFTAQGRSELNLQEGQIVKLISHVDADWTEGEVDGQQGLFPTSFVDIVVDCAPYTAVQDGHSNQPVEAASESHSPTVSNITSKDKVASFPSDSRCESGKSSARESLHAVTDSTSHAPLTAAITEVLEVSGSSEIGLVLHTFHAEMEGDVSVEEGETVEVVRQVDQNWLEVRLDNSLKGLVPRNHVEIIGLWPKEGSGSINSASGEDTEGSAWVNVKSLECESEVKHQEKYGPSKNLYSSHPCPTQEIHDRQSEKPTNSNYLSSEAISTASSKPTQALQTPLSLKQPVSLPGKKSNFPFLPNMLPKPVLPPKPKLKPKPPMDRSQSLNSSKPARPPPLVTAKPYSSLPRAKHHHVVSPNERRLSMSSLDSVIEVEMEKAKSRSSSQNSDPASDKNSIVISGDSTYDKNDAQQYNDSASDPTKANASLESNSMFNTEKRQSLPSSFKSSDLKIPANSDSVREGPKSSKDHLCFDDDFSEVPLSSEDFALVTNTTSVPVSGTKPALLSSQSVSEDKPSGLSEADQRRKSAPFGEQTRFKVGLPSATPKIGAKQSSFVNKAFEMDVDEGRLVDLGGDHQCLQAVPKQKPPSRPNSATPAPQSLQGSKTKAPPPRPSGPKIASAPSKVPLVPARAAPTPPKLVPKRPAPKAPGAAPSANFSNNNNNDYKIDGKLPEASAALQELGAPLARPAPQPPMRQLPRPASLVTPPHRAPPPRPTDLIVFSPEEPNSQDEKDDDISEETKKEMLRDLKAKLEENKADIKKYEEERLDLQTRLAEAPDDSAHLTETRDQLQFVESTLAGLQEEGRGLKENLFSLDPHEARLEKARLLAAQHAMEEERRKEEERLAELERKRKRREHRANVLDEIVDTEKDYLFSMHLCLETFLEGPKPPAGVDLEFLLGNMEEIADVSQKVLLKLEASILGKNRDDQCVGRCFSAHAEDMKNTYAPYCRNHDDVITVLERLADPSTPQVVTDYINERLDKMREQMNVFDLAGVLIKPVQRILKYPLLLNELLKNTESDHPDKADIIDAIKAMTDVAKAINEYKRRKDLVYKYKKSSDQSFSDKISKLNLHSIKKKSSRMKGRLSTNLGIGLQTRDEAFEREEIKFRSIEKAVKIFQRSVVQYLNDSQEQMHCRELFVEDVVEFYSDRLCIEVQKLQEVMVMLVELFVKMKETIENVVVVPLNTLVSLFNAPSHVIEKRFDKLLDYNNQLGKTENDKELQAARNDYEAMNAQLLDELPKFYDLAFGMLRNCVSAYVLARRDFMDQSLKESCCLLELPSIAHKANVMEVFSIRHTTSYDHVSLLSFIPRGFNPRVDTIKADKARLKGKTGPGEITQSNTNTTAQTTPGSQSDSQRAYLRSTYPANKLFKVTKSHVASDLMDISLTEGMLVGVVKELDPMGNKERWFLDDGLSKGFAPSTGLTPAALSPVNSDNADGILDEDVLSVHSHDSGENVVISGNDGRAAFTSGTTLLESSPHRQEEEQTKQYHYALYDFAARQANEASLQAGHPVNVIAFQDVDGNTEWWLVEGADGQRGYAPANYMAPMPYS